MARLRFPRPKASWQGPLGALAVVAAVGGLTGSGWWALLVAGGFLLLAALGV